jgi:lipopolysaccharide transport system ATP-binding protein
MASIEFNNVCVDFPIYNASSRSLKGKLAQVATGGQLGANEQGVVVVRALEELTFTLKDGDRVGLLGHNGAGKSTLLRLLSGVYWPSSGSVTVTGKVSSLIDISFGIDLEITGRRNAYLRGGLLGLSKAEITEQMDAYLLKRDAPSLSICHFDNSAP